MMSCRHCGTANESEAEKCRRCGRLLHKESMVGKIACVNHANREAISTCNGCGARLCDICAYTVDDLDFCQSCAPEGAVLSGEGGADSLPVIDRSEAERATVGARLSATVIDTAIIAVFAFIIYLLMGLTTRNWRDEFVPRHNILVFVVYWLLVLLAGVAYHTVQLTLTGQTVGKQLCRVIVLTEDGTIINFQQALARTLYSLLSLIILGLGFFVALWSPEKETWHDRWSQTFAFRYADTT